jgi:hypothetical protein
MKRIYLNRLPDPRFPVGSPEYEPNLIDYRSTIEQCIRSPLNRQTGASIDEMRRGIRILDALDAAQDDVLALEDADWEHLKQKVEAMPWIMVDRRIVTFYDDITQATDAPRVPARVNHAPASA